MRLCGGLDKAFDRFVGGDVADMNARLRSGRTYKRGCLVESGLIATKTSDGISIARKGYCYLPPDVATGTGDEGNTLRSGVLGASASGSTNAPLFSHSPPSMVRTSPLI